LKSIPEAEQEKFEEINPNEWLAQHVPWTNADIFFLQPMPIWNKPNCFLWQNVMRFS